MSPTLRQQAPARPDGPGLQWHAALRPKGLRDSPVGGLVAMVCVVAVLLLFMVEATHPYGSSVGSLVVVPVLAAAWALPRRDVLGITALAAVSRVGVVLLGQTSVATGVAQVAAVLLVALIIEVLAERSLMARAGVLRAEGIRELSHLLDTVRRLSASHDADAVVREVVVAAGRSMARRGAPPPRAALVRVVDDRIREGVEPGDDSIDLGGVDLPLSCAPAIAEALGTGRAVVCPTAAMLPPLRDLTERASVVATVYAPIRVGGDAYGVLATGLRHRVELDPSELRLLEGMADIAGLAIANADRLKLERSHLRRVEALERAKGAFLNRASHELRTPLTVLRGYLHLMEEGAFGDLGDEITQDVVPSLVTSVEEINSLVEGMLVAARLEYGVELDLAPLDLREVVRDTVHGVEETFAGEPAPTVIIETPATPVTVLGDAEQIATIVANLVRNAMKASPPHAEVRCVVAARGGVVGTVSVVDRGPGIPAEHLPRLFTRFGRIDVPGAGGARGAGLGLYIARELGRMHGGDVTVQTQSGVGSTFELTLPLDTGELPAEPSAATSEVAGRLVEPASRLAPTAETPTKTPARSKR
jgi:signal transduction histidine kinase